MHLVTLDKPLDDGRWNLAADSYLAEDLTAFEIAIAAERGSAQVQSNPRSLGLDANRLNPRKRWLWIHNGGYGDLIMATPAIRELARARPEVELTLSCRQRVHCIFDGLPFAPKLIDYPVPLTVADHFDRVLCSEHIQESSDEGKTTPAIDLKAALLGVGPLVDEQRRVSYRALMQETEWAYGNYSRTHRKRIGIQLKSSSPTRDYHPSLMSQVMTGLYEAGHEIFLFGSPKSCPLDAIPAAKRGLIRNLTQESLTFRQSAAIMQTCDVMFGPDSSASHVCGALNIPGVFVFGSTAWQQRTADYPTVTAIQGHIPCSPCWHHPRGAAIFPRGEPCATKGFCGAVNSIPPERVLSSIAKKLK